MNLHILLLHSKDDEIAPIAMSQYFINHSICNPKLLIYEGLKHELFFEPENKLVIEDIVRWIDRFFKADKNVFGY